MDNLWYFTEGESINELPMCLWRIQSDAHAWIPTTIFEISKAF